jgi:hypothetical protein
MGSLPPVERFLGAGVYAIYYFGEDPLYAQLGEHNRSSKSLVPIYVGKAVPRGARKGANLEAASGSVLFERLAEHAESIDEAQNLDSGDFGCRYLAVEDIFIPLGESLLVSTFSPVWNVTIDGFGNHDPGAGRYQQQSSSWDVLHPGRSWAAKLAPHKSDRTRIEERVSVHFHKHPLV